MFLNVFLFVNKLLNPLRFSVFLDKIPSIPYNKSNRPKKDLL